MEDLEKTTEATEQTEVQAEEKQPEEIQAEDKKEKGAGGKRRKRRRALMVVIMLAILAAFLFFVVMVIGIKNSSSPVGYWVIKESSSSGVTMNQEDAKAMGLNEIGSVRLDKSGDCKVVILNEESEGTWTSDDEGNITISYGEEKTLTATINDEGVMTAQDEHSIEYTLEK